MTTKKIKNILKTVFVRNIELKLTAVLLTVLTFIMVNI